MKNPVKKINLDELFWGKEPVWNQPEELPLSRALSWYSNQFGPKESKKYTMDYVRKYKYPKDIIEKLDNSKDYLFLNLGFVCRIIMRGANINKEDYINDKITDIINYEEPERFAERRHTVQERIVDLGTEYINEIEEYIECFISKKPVSTFNCYEWLVSRKIKQVYVKQIIDFYTPMFNELYVVYNKSDIQVIEYYSSWSKKSIKECYLFLKDVLDTCNNYIDNKKVSKPKKQLNKDKLLLTLKYKKEDIEYKITSIDPKNIIGSTQLWVFNTKYKTLGRYIALNESGLSIKGTTLLDYDENVSIQKVLKKPLDVLPKVITGKKMQLKDILSTQKTKESLLNGRINADIILLRFIK